MSVTQSEIFNLIYNLNMTKEVTYQRETCDITIHVVVESNNSVDVTKWVFCTRLLQTKKTPGQLQKYVLAIRKKVRTNK